MRLALAVEYDGTGFCGWQRQPHCVSVQQALESAVSRVADHDVTLHCAGRTDTGVHAMAQIVHFDTPAVRPLRAWTFGVNSNLDARVAVHWAKPVPEHFHARFKALHRSYRYSIANQATRPAVLRHTHGWVNQPLDVERMQAAARHLLGTHDFSSFRSAECQAQHAVRELQHIEVTRQANRVYIDVRANGFLHNMVRILTGCLIRIGKGERPEDWLAELLAARDRTQAAMTAAPGGLSFVQPAYPAEYAVPDFRQAFLVSSTG